MDDGKYRARAKSWGFGVAGTGTEQIGITFELSDTGESITWYGFFNTEENGKRALKAMRTCGWDDNDPDILNPKGLDRNEVELVVEGEEYNGTRRPKVKWVNALGGAALKPLADSQRAKLASKIAGWVKPGNGKPKPKAPVGGGGDPIDADDLPF